MPTLADIQARIDSAQAKLDQLRKTKAEIAEVDKKIAALGNLTTEKTRLEGVRDQLIAAIRSDFNAPPSP